MNGRLPRGIVDTHVHSAPDAVPRLLNDIEISRAASEANYRGVVLKSHHTITSARARIAQDVLDDGIHIMGGVALNLHSTGGINRYALEAALRIGTHIVWMPTFTSMNQIRDVRSGGGDYLLRALGDVDENDGIEVLDADRSIRPDVVQIIDMIAAEDVTLATGHLSAEEIMALVPVARERGVSRIIVTHPELQCVGLSVEQQLELSELGGVWFERVYAVTLPHIGYPVDAIAEAARIVGFESTIMATDLGQAVNPPPVAGMESYIGDMMECGINHDEIEIMTCMAPAEAMGL